LNQNPKKILINENSDLKNCSSDTICGIINDKYTKGIKYLENRDCILYILGDLIIPKNNKKSSSQYLNSVFENFEIKTIQNLKGTFYLIKLNKQNMKIEIYNSLFSLLPIYYYKNKDFVFISSRIEHILDSCSDTFFLNKKYILEKALFGYALFNSTYFKNIRTVPCNSYLSLDGTVKLVKHTEILDYYCENPVKWPKSVDRLSDLFIAQAKDYLPDDKFYSSMTGGLDGRTLVALALGMGKDFCVYSYGNPREKDVFIPQYICKKIGLKYYPIYLHDDFAKIHFLKNAFEGEILTEGNLRFSRAQYNFFSKKFSSKPKYIITGLFGSELLRTMRMPGNLISQVLFDIFSIEKDRELVKKIRHSNRLKFIRLDQFQNELDELLDDIFSYRNAFPSGLSVNKKFYYYLFEEVFRKYFGPEIILEYNYLVNRMPFLDFGFFKELLKTELAGCNADFQVSNPIDRFKGQVLYPLIIKKTYPKLLKYKLDRSYKPNDFLVPWGKFNITKAYFYRKLFDRKRYKPPSYATLCFETNISKLMEIQYNKSVFNDKYINYLFTNDNWKTDFIHFNIFISSAKYISEINRNNCYAYL